MTQELSNCFLVPSGFESLVLKLWASYLQKCNAGFISHCKEILPKLKINFKHRDGRVRINVNKKFYCFFTCVKINLN